MFEQNSKDQKIFYATEDSRHAFCIEETIANEILKIHHNDILTETQSAVWKSDWHKHSWCEIVICLSGEEQILFDNQPSIIMKSHDICIIPEKTLHSCRPISNTQKRISILLSNLPISKNIKEMPLSLIIDTINQKKQIIQIENDSTLYSIIQEVLTALQTEHPFNSIFFKYQILLFVLKCLGKIYYRDHLFSIHKYNFNTSLFHHDSNSIRLQQIEMFLGKYYANCTLKDLANFLNLGTRQTSRLVIQHYGMTFKETVNHYRILTAQKLLLEGKKINQVAEYVGYKSLVGFRTTFKALVNCTPSEFLERYVVQGLPQTSNLLSFHQEFISSKEPIYNTSSIPPQKKGEKNASTKK